MQIILGKEKSPINSKKKTTKSKRNERKGEVLHTFETSIKQLCHLWQSNMKL